MRDVQSFANGHWIAPDDSARGIDCAITGAAFARAGSQRLDLGAMIDHARRVGGPALRAMTFHDRARMLKALAQHLGANKDPLYALSHHTGATQRDNLIDIDGGIGTLFVYASKGRREMPDARVYVDGTPEILSKDGSFLGQHIAVPMEGVALHINAFNFPVWGMLEKLAPTLLAGMPAIVKPATASSYVTEACFRLIIDSGLLPEGAVQLVAGGVGDALDHLGTQDALAFTGSAATADHLRAHPAFLTRGARFMAEQDSLNASILGADVAPGSPTYETFLREVQREMTAKAGQKCTAIRRILVPEAVMDRVSDDLAARLAQVRIGDPRLAEVQMGALVSKAQERDVRQTIETLRQEADLVLGGSDAVLMGDGTEGGAFVPPTLLRCDAADHADLIHRHEAFGPVSTLMGYGDAGQAADIANRGGGSLVVSVFSDDAPGIADLAVAMAPWHGRVYVTNAAVGKAATGHGAPMPHMVHGGPGRAGGGEELGGIRGVMHYMQRTAIQGPPEVIRQITSTWLPGAETEQPGDHPFARPFGDLQIGDTLTTAPRVITLEDIEHFADFTGDRFYAHMDEDAAAANPFFPGRVAHGYLLLSFAAGLFVKPEPGPVLANTGLDNLRFLKPVQAGDALHVHLTVKAKTPRTEVYGEIRWHVDLRNQNDEAVAVYELLTMNAL